MSKDVTWKLTAELLVRFQLNQRTNVPMIDFLCPTETVGILWACLGSSTSFLSVFGNVELPSIPSCTEFDKTRPLMVFRGKEAKGYGKA